MGNIYAAPAKRVQSIDGLRGFAILIVLLVHTLGIPAGGELGVDIFFTMSGYLISSQLFAESAKTGTINLRLFYWKRCKRLVPAFLAVCLLYVAMSYCFPASVPSPNLLKMLSLLLMSNIYWAQGVPPIPFLQHTWSLAVEWQFYLAWPVVLIVFSKLGVGRKGTFAFLVLTVVSVWVARSQGDQFLRFDGVLMGSMIPLVQDSKSIRRVCESKYAAWLIFMPCLIAIIVLVYQPVLSYLGPTKPVISVLTAGIIAFLAIGQGSRATALFDNRFLRHFGEISYGLYLYHFPIAALMYVNGMLPTKMLVVGLLVSIPIAEVSWLYLESPLLQSGRSKGRP